MFILASAIAQRIEYAAMYTLPLTLGTFIEQLNNGKTLPTTKIYGMVVAALVLVQCISIDFANDLLIVGQILCAVMIFYVIAYDAVYAFYRKVKEQMKKEEH